MSRRWTEQDAPDQTGRLAVVTGANAGLGYETALMLAGRGARVVLACRDLTKGEAAAERIRAATPTADVVVRRLDLADLDSVDAFADRFRQEHDRLDLLINNAGIMAVDHGRTAQGIELQFGVNHLGHVALTLRLLPQVIAAGRGSRVVTVSSMGHRAGRLRFDDLQFDRGYRRWGAYFQSKLANLAFTAELQRRLAEAGHETIAVAAHPGASRTDLGTEGHAVSNRLMGSVVPLVTQPARIGALSILRAATDPAARGGAFYGPRWLALGHPVLEVPSRRARDAGAARRLWDESQRLLGLDLDVPVG